MILSPFFVRCGIIAGWFCRSGVRLPRYGVDGSDARSIATLPWFKHLFPVFFSALFFLFFFLVRSYACNSLVWDSQSPFLYSTSWERCHYPQETPRGFESSLLIGLARSTECRDEARQKGRNAPQSSDVIQRPTLKDGNLPAQERVYK